MKSPSDELPIFDDLNAFLASLTEVGDLVEIKDELQTRLEIPAILRELGEREGPAALFTNVADHSGAMVIGNLLGHRRRVARAFGVEADRLTEQYVTRKARRIAPQMSADAPVKEVTTHGDDIDLYSLLPALVHHEEDTSPYLTCAVTIARDPDSGGQSMGLHRIQVRSPNSLAIYLATPPLARFLEQAGDMQVPLEVAVVIGPDPLVLVASVTWCPEGSDKLEIAGGLRNRPVPVVFSETGNLKIPAFAQYVLEGVIQPADTAYEGPFGDSSGTYVEAYSPVMTVSKVTCRKNPLYQALQPWSSEDDALINLCFGSDLLESVRRDHPFVQDVHLVPGTVGAHAVCAVRDVAKAQVRSAICAILVRNPFIKRVVAVDDDIDIRNYREVEWALSTRFQADRGLMVLPRVQGSVIDPSASPQDGTCKIGIDATYPKHQSRLFKKITLSESSRARAKAILDLALQST